MTGNAIKAGVRFLSYDHFKSMLKDENGKLSGPRSLLAGLGAGMMEAIFAVTPSETIKTKLIDDGKRAVPKYPKGLFPVRRRSLGKKVLRASTGASSR